jgi:hypothetical protein
MQRQRSAHATDSSLLARATNLIEWPTESLRYGTATECCLGRFSNEPRSAHRRPRSSISALDSALECRASWVGRSAMKIQPTEEPQTENDDQHQAESTADARTAIPTVSVIAPAPAEQQDDQDNDQDCAHLLLSFRPRTERLTDIPTLNGRQTDGRKNLEPPHNIAGTVRSRLYATAPARANPLAMDCGCCWNT